MKSHRDVVISGAGVAGLTLAAALSRQGLDVLVVDKQASPAPIHKGEILQPRSLEILDTLGALDPLRSRGALTATRLVCRRPDARAIGALDYSLLRSPYRHLMLHYYADINEALSAAGGAEVRRGTVVTGPLVAPDGRITGVQVRNGTQTAEVTAALTVSGEGRGSRLGRFAGCDVAPIRYPHRLLAFDLEGSTAEPELTAYLTRRGLRLIYPMPGGRARLYVQVGVDEYRRTGRAGLRAWADGVVSGVPALQPLHGALIRGLGTVQPLDASRYHADRWFSRGFALIGDAAHGVHPMAAQGMNSAIADAWELAEQLAVVGSLSPGAVDRAVASYASVRSQRMAYVARLSHNLARVFTDTRWRTRAMTELMFRRAADDIRLQSILVYNMSGLGVQRFSRRDRLHQFGLLRHRMESSV